MKERYAEALLIFVIIMRSTSYLFSKIGLATLPPLEILAIRFTAAFLILGLIFFNYLRRYVTADLLKGAAKLGSLMFACMTCELISLTTIDSSMASFLENTAVAWVPVITAVIYHRRPEKIVILCTLLIICGVGLLTLNGAEFRPGRGELICLTGSVCYAFWIIATAKTAHHFDPLSLGIMQFFFLSLYSSIGTVLFETPFIPTRPVEWQVISALTFICTILGFTLQPVAQRYTTAEKAGLFTAINPLFAAIFGFFILDERFTAPQITGGILILGVILLLQIAGSRKKNKIVPKLTTLASSSQKIQFPLYCYCIMIMYIKRRQYYMLKKNMLYIGIIFLFIGLATVFLNPDQQQANLEIARHATNAQAAAQAISANNQRETLIHIVGMFITGLGLAMTIGGFIVRKQNKN